MGDAANHFHYYRLTRDNRILWGGYDAVYHFGSRIPPELDQREDHRRAAARHFFDTFPQLEVGFTHKWGGVIDTCTRFCAFFGTAYDGRVAYAAGFTGLGVGAPASAPASCSTCSGRRRPSSPSCGWCTTGRCRSRPSR